MSCRRFGEIVSLGRRGRFGGVEKNRGVFMVLTWRYHCVVMVFSICFYGVFNLFVL